MSSVNSDVPLSALAQSLMDNDVSPSPLPVRSMDRMDRMGMDKMDHMDHMHDHHHHHHQKSKMGFSHFLFYFLVLVLVFYFLYFALRPYFVLRQDCDSRSQQSSQQSSDESDSRDISQSRLLVSAIFSAVVLMFVLWLFSLVASYAS